MIIAPDAPLWVPNPPRIMFLDDPTQALVNEMFTQWARKNPRNITRLLYFEGRTRLKDLRIAIPPHLVDKLEVVMGWPEKAVYEVANRVQWQGINSPDGSQDPFELSEVLFENRFAAEFPQLEASALSQSVAFMSVTPGDPSNQEPAALIMSHSALWATGLWDVRRRGFKAAMFISEVDDLGRPTSMTIMLPQEFLLCQNPGGDGAWFVANRIPNRIGRVPFEMFPYRPVLDRPFGKSRIDRVVMSLTDRAVRAGSRLEVHSELFSAIKLILLGADENTFKDSAGNDIPLWSFYMGRMNWLTRDEDGELPNIEQIAAQSPQPHIDVLKELASEFSGHTGVPLTELGVSQDNPESAAARDMARLSIVMAAQRTREAWETSLVRTFESAVMIRNNLTTPPDGFHQLSMSWGDADAPSRAAKAAAGAQQVAADPVLQGTDVGLELLGLTPDQIRRVREETRRANAPGVLSQLLNRAPAAPAAQPGEPAAQPPAPAAQQAEVTGDNQG